MRWLAADALCRFCHEDQRHGNGMTVRDGERSGLAPLTWQTAAPLADPSIDERPPAEHRGTREGTLSGKRRMTGPSRVQALMREIGPLLELEQVSDFDGEREWALVVDAATVVHADYVEADDRLMLSIELGRPPEASHHRIYELLLLYNHGWPETGGVRMALESPGGTVVQLFETGAADLD